MLQVAYIRENREKVVSGLNKRRFGNAAETIDKVMELDDLRKNTQSKHDQVLAESNSLSKQIGGLMREGKKEEAEEIKKKTADLKMESKQLGEELSRCEEELKQLLYTIPNIPNDNVPEGAGADDNQVVYEHGTTPKLSENALPHWELIKKYDIIDFELGNKITGAGFPVYKGQGARLQRAMVNFFLDEALKAGYVEIQPPIVINEDSGYGTGQLPDKDGQMYHISEENFFLIPTAEVPITNLYRDVILDTGALPVKHVGFTPCFRREAGSWGAHVRGLNRLHQFDKVEIVEIHHPDNSYAALERMCKHVQGLLEKLQLQYRVLNLCGGDMGFTSAQTFDMEVFSAAQQKWLEVSSVSNFETFQANRLKLRYRGEDNKMHLLHTLNGSALALPRILAAILENNQSDEGIKIPDVLVPYTGFDTIR
ncbi:Seryl-tRNA synthetase [Fulvivirga imtechensis AK7]|uniref:Serine--tRNA ligase n=1 Tax=Fulvivirga imtechensis AK7 TaxID=1237149 RepID=L8JRW9_9BACT|nr:serine--tRNA ligase [Fulvivirga imtechensis]ELR70948.1 Seryl-tRNA synthetase [Fulvivirga imtechensis AK7]